MAHDSTANGEHHGLAHIMPIKTLFAVWAALMVGTIITVLAIKIDLGPSANLGVAMVIATIKAGLVVLYFMHLKYDKRFNLLIFVASVLFMTLFLSFTMLDSGEYQDEISRRREALEAIK